MNASRQYHGARNEGTVGEKKRREVEEPGDEQHASTSTG
jgi:hypothetical protein